MLKSPLKNIKEHTMSVAIWGEGGLNGEWSLEYMLTRNMLL